MLEEMIRRNYVSRGAFFAKFFVEGHHYFVRVGPFASIIVGAFPFHRSALGRPYFKRRKHVRIRFRGIRVRRGARAEE